MASGIVEGTNQDSSSSQQPQQGHERGRATQRLLGRSVDLPTFLRDLLTKMAVMVAGYEAAAFVIERRQMPAPPQAADDADPAAPAAQDIDPDAETVDGQAEPASRPALQSGPMMAIEMVPVVHLAPETSDAEAKANAIKEFQERVLPCLQQNKDGFFEDKQTDSAEPEFCLVTLLRNEGIVVAAAAVLTRARDAERARQRLNSMQLLGGQFEVFGLRRAVEQARAVAGNQQNILQLASAVGTADGFESAAMNLCNELANRSGADRVSLGWLKGDRIRVRALSHTEKFDKKQELIVQIERVMEECLDQEEPVRFDFDGQRSHNVTRAAEQLSRMHGGNSVVSLPLRRHNEDAQGVLTMEFPPPAKIPDQMVEALMTAAGVLTPNLRDRYENDRWLPVKIGHSIQYTTGLAIGRKHMLPKVVILAVLGALAFLIFYKPMYHVSAPFNFMAIGKRPVSIPFDGRIESIGENPRTHRIWMAGDDVKKGDVLAKMNVDELREELLKAKEDENSSLASAAAARSEIPQPGKAGEMREYEEKAKAAHAQAELYNLRIGEANITADSDGIIVRADELDTKRNSQAKEGELLMEIAPHDDYRGVLAVSEKDIQNIKEGGVQKVELAASSFPGDEIIAHIDRVAAPGEAKEGDNVFEVYATIDKGQQRNWIRQGMAGEARVDVEKRRLIWIWTHRLVEFLQLKLWM